MKTVLLFATPCDVVTETAPVLAVGGTIARIRVAETNVVEVAVAVPNLTFEPAVKPFPAMVTAE